MDKLAGKILAAAYEHGEESGNDAEIGDLQQVIMIAFDEMSPNTKRRVYSQCQEAIDIDGWLSYSEDLHSLPRDY